MLMSTCFICFICYHVCWIFIEQLSKRGVFLTRESAPDEDKMCLLLELLSRCGTLFLSSTSTKRLLSLDALLPINRFVNYISIGFFFFLLLLVVDCGCQFIHIKSFVTTNIYVCSNFLFHRHSYFHRGFTEFCSQHNLFHLLEEYMLYYNLIGERSDTPTVLADTKSLGNPTMQLQLVGRLGSRESLFESSLLSGAQILVGASHEGENVFININNMLQAKRPLMAFGTLMVCQMPLIFIAFGTTCIDY